MDRNERLEKLKAKRDNTLTELAHLDAKIAQLTNGESEDSVGSSPVGVALVGGVNVITTDNDLAPVEKVSFWVRLIEWIKEFFNG